MKQKTSFLFQPDRMDFHTPPETQHNVAPQDLNYNAPTNRGEDMIKVMQNPNVITELLVKQQKQSPLPVKDIPVFRGDALQYKSFNRAFATVASGTLRTGDWTEDIFRCNLLVSLVRL